MTLAATFYSVFLLPDSMQRLKRWLVARIAPWSRGTGR
jgi:hypothetical protein